MNIIIGIIAVIGWIAYFRKTREYNKMESFIIKQIVDKGAIE